MSDMPKVVHILDTGPRDGLQIEKTFVPTANKIRMIEALADAGVKEIEASSFVNPRAVPQMADADEVFSGIRRKEGVTYSALWLNPKGLERAIANGNVDVTGKLTMTVSETFIRRNTNRGIEDTLNQMPDWIARYKAAGIEVTSLGVMAAFGCNFEGYIPEARVIELIARSREVMADHGCTLKRLNLADTMGWASPLQIKRLVGGVRERWPDLRIRLHLHDTRGQAVANAVAGMEMGVAHFDASVGGLGGCPFAGHKGAAGNIATEDLVFTCEEMGIETGIDLDAMVEVARMAEEWVGHELPGKVMKGGTLTRFKKLQ
jgi:hydroxymethylglutaryl-CoA lyase